MTYKVVKVKFSNSNRSYFFLENDLNLENGDIVIVESDRGIQLARVVSEIIEITDDKLSKPLKKVIRKASKEDKNVDLKNQKDATKALVKAKKLAEDLGLNMRILNANFTFDRNQLVFNFVADDRIDFRELAKKLASIYKTRIELRQIGVRDKAKEIGGIGPCGRFLCCNLFLNDFESVSINMAKNQYISLKPDKINGICGRLLCCLNYEDDQYTELKENMPPIGSTIRFDDISGKVVAHNLFKKTFDIEKRDKTIVTVDVEKYESNK